MLSTNGECCWVSGVWASTRRLRSQCACCVAAVAAKYSASHVESSNTDCLAEVELIGATCNMCATLVLERRAWSLAKSEVLDVRRLGQAFNVLALNKMPLCLWDNSSPPWVE